MMVENSHTEVEKTHLEMVERATWRWRKNPNGSVRERRSYLGEVNKQSYITHTEIDKDKSL